MIRTFLLTLLIAFIALPGAQAKDTSKSSGKKGAVTKKASSRAQKSQLGTSFSFDAASVRGKYQMAGQGVATIEDEKVLEDLLGMRKHFKDREQTELSRR